MCELYVIWWLHLFIYRKNIILLTHQAIEPSFENKEIELKEVNKFD